MFRKAILEGMLKVRYDVKDFIESPRQAKVLMPP
jgi:hypothetical protein